MSLVGWYSHSLDAKNRVFIPAKFREELGDEFYITRKFDKFLSVLTSAAWEEFMKKLDAIPETEAVQVLDFILGSAQKCVPDASGRIILDEKLIKHADIKKNIVFVGNGRQIRIWSEEHWIEQEEHRDENAILATMKKYGL
jgi:MraZ protein